MLELKIAIYLRATEVCPHGHQVNPSVDG